MQTPESRPRVWATNTFLRIGNLLGHSRALALLGDYADYLSRASAEIGATPFDAERLHRTLHDLRSTSGILGFEALADTCATILSDDPETPTTQQIARLRDLARDSLAAAHRHLGLTGATAAA